MRTINSIVGRFLEAKKPRKPRTRKPRTKNFNSNKVRKTLNNGRHIWHKLR